MNIETPAADPSLSPVRVWKVGSYDDARRIKECIAQILDAQPQRLHPLLEAGPNALAVVKPNWVQEAHEHRPGVWEPVITHPRVVLAVVEALAERIGQGTICLCDAPHTYASFESILKRGDLLPALEAVRAKWPRLRIELLDLRREIWIRKEEVVVERRPNPDDPRGYVRVDLGRASFLFRHRGEGSYYGADYDAGVVNEHHRGEKQEYLLSGTAMACHLFVNVPKLKTHKKTGITCCLKNLVGINGDKNWLPHHTERGPAWVGDEYPVDGWPTLLERALKKPGRRLALSMPGVGTWIFRKMRIAGKVVLGDSETVVRNGNWHGNDTCWRMALDLNRALLYANLDGSWRDKPDAKPYLAIVDGIVGGEGNGPLCPDPVSSSVLLGGTDPAAVDAAACRLMGFDPWSLPLVRHAFAEGDRPISAVRPDDVRVWDERAGREVSLAELEPSVPGGFQPHFGWEAKADLRAKATRAPR